MTIRIVQLGSPRRAGEGVRIGTVRRPPRGVPKSEFASRDWYDIWFPNLAPSLDLFADVLLNPSFPKADFERLRKEALVRLQSSKLEPASMAGRVLPPLLYGPQHAYGALGGGRVHAADDVARKHAL